MDDQLITQAAVAAVTDLRLDCRIRKVYQAGGKGKWCIEFTDWFGRLCDEFRDDSGEENSPALIREKVKRYLFKRRKPSTRRIRESVATSAGRPAGALSGIPIRVVEEAVDQAGHVATRVIDQAEMVTDKAIDAAARVAKRVATELSQPSPQPQLARPRSKRPAVALVAGSVVARERITKTSRPPAKVKSVKRRATSTRRTAGAAKKRPTAKKGRQKK
jgi:hypothetical protein